MLLVNPYHITEKQAATYVRLSVNELKNHSVPYLQYGKNTPKYFQRSDLDSFIKRNTHVCKKSEREGGIYELAT